MPGIIRREHEEIETLAMVAKSVACGVVVYQRYQRVLSKNLLSYVVYLILSNDSLNFLMFSTDALRFGTITAFT